MIYKTAILALSISMFFMLGATPTKEKQEVIRFVMPANMSNCFIPLPCNAYAIGYNTMGTGVRFSDEISIKVDKKCIREKILPLLKKDGNGEEFKIRFGF